MGYVEMMHKNK